MAEDTSPEVRKLMDEARVVAKMLVLPSQVEDCTLALTILVVATADYMLTKIQKTQRGR